MNNKTMSFKRPIFVNYEINNVTFTIDKDLIKRIFVKSTIGIVCLELHTGEIIETNNGLMELAEQYYVQN